MSDHNCYLYNNFETKLKILGEKLRTKEVRNILVLAGPGLSTAAGVPDIQDPQSDVLSAADRHNLTDPNRIYDSSFFLKQPEPFFDVLRKGLGHDLKPTIGHTFIKLLELKDVLLRLFTMNVDGIEHDVGINPDKLIELCGSIRRSQCTSCNKAFQYRYFLEELRGKQVPKCNCCQGIVKPDIILLGDPPSRRSIKALKKDPPNCDLFIIMGIPLITQPWTSLINRLPSTCQRVIISDAVSGGSVGFDFKPDRDLLIRESCDDGGIMLSDLAGWREELKELYHYFSPNDGDRI